MNNPWLGDADSSLEVGSTVKPIIPVCCVVDRRRAYGTLGTVPPPTPSRMLGTPQAQPPVSLPFLAPRNQVHADTAPSTVRNETDKPNVLTAYLPGTRCGLSCRKRAAPPPAQASATAHTGWMLFFPWEKWQIVTMIHNVKKQPYSLARGAPYMRVKATTWGTTDHEVLVNRHTYT